MSKVITGDILNIKKGIIVHQVNCQGVMGAGLAKQIKQKYPEVFTKYKKHMSIRTTKQLLGSLQVIPIGENNDFWIINLFGQKAYGKNKKIVYTSYSAHNKVWFTICKWEVSDTMDVYAPFYIGAGLANGDWKKIHKIAEEYVPNITWVKYKRSFEF